MGYSCDRPADSPVTASIARQGLRDYSRLEKILDACARAALVLDLHRQVVYSTASARRWVRTYFGEFPPSSRLPELLDLWVRQHEAAVRMVLGLPDPRDPLVIRRGSRRLVLRLVSGRETVIVLEEQCADIDADSLRSLPLSRREREILAEVANGCNNGEIARELGISVRTVEAHILHICARLRVHSRIAAASRAFAECRISLNDRSEDLRADDIRRSRRRGAKQ